MNILYISSACSEKVMKFVFEELTDKSGIAIQKFHLLLLSGFANGKSNTVQTLSTIPVSPGNHHKKFWNTKADEFNKIQFNYIPIINVSILKNSIVFIYSFFKCLFWKFPEKSQSKMVICDVLSIALSSASLLAFKIRGVKTIGLVTDIPGISAKTNGSTLNKIFEGIAKYFLYKYDGYILLTKQMNEVANPKGKKFIIMEGLVDGKMISEENTLERKNKNRILLYAGGLYEKYGIKILIEAFNKLGDTDLRLYLYGTGPMNADMDDYMKKDHRIKYFGVLPNHEVVKTQLSATLLINPRPTSEEYVKYSFPSKNMEYMASGTPVVTTLLPGMGTEYMPYVYIIREENVNGIYKTLNKLLSKSAEELHQFGQKAKCFVIQNKNNNIQAKRIIDFFS